MNTRTRTKRWLIILMLILGAGSLAMGGLYAQGFWDETKAVHIRASDIEPSTLAIGTHLIHLSALTDSIYEIASQSAEDSGQNTIYYKSELGGNAWFDITSATSLADITFEGTAVKNEDIEALFFTHHTKSDKVTYDLRTGKAVNVFNIRDPYELESLDELSPLKMYYDQIIEMEGENDITKRIDQIWQTPLTGEGILEKEKAKAAAEAARKALENALNALLDQLNGLLQPEEPEVPEEKEPETTQVERMDAQLAALQRYLDVLTKYDAETWQIDKVSGVMAAVDAGRRYQVFVFVEEALNEYMDELSGNADGETPSELLSALAESIGNVQESLITYGGKMLDEGMTVISNAEYEFSNDLIRHAEADDHAACDNDTKNLRLLGNLQNDIISDRPGELALLDDKLIPNAQQIYLLVLGAGESAEYRAAVQNKAAQALLNSLIAEYEMEVNTRRGEVEFLIQAKTSRMDAQSASEYIQALMDSVARDYAVAVPKDAFLNAGLDSVTDHINFLSDLQRSLSLALGGNEMDQLMAEKEELQTQRMQALDNNDLAGAKALEEQINAVEEEIRAIEAEAAAQIAQLQNSINSMEPGSAERAAAEAELANLQNSFSDGSMAARVNDLKKEVLDSIPTGSFSPSGAGAGDGGGSGVDTEAAEKLIEENVNILVGLMDVVPELALAALENVHEALVDGNADQALTGSVEQALEKCMSDVEARVAERIAQLQTIVDTVDPDSAGGIAAKEKLADLNTARVDGSVVAGVEQLKQTVLDSIATGRNRAGAARAQDILVDLLELVPELALPALQEIYDALIQDGGDRDAISTVGQAIGACVEPLEEKLAGRVEQLEALVGTLAPGSGELTAAQAELDALKHMLDAESVNGGVSDLTQETVENIGHLSDAGTGDGTGDGLGTQSPGSGSAETDATDALGTLTGLLGTAPELVLPALQDIYNKLLLNGGDQDMVDAIEQAIVDNPYALRDGMSPEQVRAVAKAWLLDQLEDASPSAPLSGAGGLSRMDDETTLAAIAGMQMYYEQTGDKAVQQVMTALAQEMQNLGDPLVFAAIKDGGGEYVPLTAVQALTGRRYVWNKNASLGVLARGSDYYGFTVYSDRVLRDRDGQKTERMSGSAKYQNGLYIPEEYAQQAFGVAANYLPGTSMGFICDEAMMEQAQEFFSWLMEA